ncbi:MAG: extracellular solute-binding protein [Clostridiales bacterium]|nr:extracellular solute-binding protein [Clostridiales bacterium]
MNLWKKYLSVGLIAALTASMMSGCSAGNAGDSGSADAEGGTYVETDYGVPGLEGADTDSYLSPTALAVLEDGTVRAMVSDDSDIGYMIIDSKDGGATWEESEMDLSALSSVFVSDDMEDESSGSYGYIYETAFDSAGDLFLVYAAYSYTTNGNTQISDGTISYYLLKTDGTLTEIPMEIPGIATTSHDEYEVYAEEEASGEEDASDESDESDALDAGDESSEEAISEDEEDDSVTVTTGDTDEEEESYNDIAEVKLLDAENLYISDYNGVIYHISVSDGSIVNKIEDFEWVNVIALNGDRLLVQAEDGFYEYDAETLKQTAQHEELYDLYLDADNFTMADSAKDDGILYYICTDGIFSYDLNADTSKQIMDGSSTSLNSTMCSMDDFFAKDDGSFLVWFSDYMTDDIYETLLNFAYDASATVSYDAELTIYALSSDNYALEAIVSLYTRKNPNIKVNVEYGLSGDDAVTSSDALRTLNTEIMAGEGPDLILLDGMDVDTYIDNGLLANLSDIVQPMLDNSELFENIAKTYQTEDGEIYAVPMGFSVPAIVGSSDILDQINSLSDYVTAAESYAASEESADTPLLEDYDLTDVFGVMTFVNAGSWFSEDGSLDEAALTDYLTNVKAFFQAAYSTLPEEDQAELESELSDLEDALDGVTMSVFGWDPASDIISIIAGASKIELGNLCYSDALEYITSAQRVDETITCKLMPGTMENVYVPSFTVGINSKSAQQEAAVDFLSYMLSEEGQTAAISYQDCYPVNLAAFDEMMVDPQADLEGYDPEISHSSVGIIDDDGTETDLDLYWPDDEQIAAFKELMLSLDTPAYMNDTILTTIVSDCYAAVVSDSVSIEDAVAQVVKDINIYLSE